MPFEGGDSAAKSEFLAKFSVFLVGVLGDLRTQGKLGNGRGQIPRDTVLALAVKLSADELDDVTRATLEIQNSLEIVPTLLAPEAGPKDDMEDLFLRDVLQRVAGLTAAGKLAEGAQAIDRALAQAQSYQGALPRNRLFRALAQPFARRAHRWQKSVLLLLEIHQHCLLRDVDRVVSALLARAALYYPKRPAWSKICAGNFEALHRDGVDGNMNFPLRVASALARHRADTARTPGERGSAFMQVAAPLMVLADREPGLAVLDEARRALVRACEGYEAAALAKELALARTCITAIDEKLAQQQQQAPAGASSKAPAAQRKAQPGAARPASGPTAQPTAQPEAETEPPQATDRYFMHLGGAAPNQAAQPPTELPGAAGGREDAGDARVRRILADLQAQGHIGEGPRRVPQDCAKAVLRAIAPQDLADQAGSTREVTFAMSCAIGVLRHGQATSPDIVLSATLQHVAESTAEGQLQRGADIIDEMLDDLESSKDSFDNDGYQHRLRGLLEASWRQAELLRDVDRALAASVSLAAMSGAERPATSPALASHIESLHAIGQEKGYRFPLRVAIAQGWLRFEAAQSDAEQGEALLQLGLAQITLGHQESNTAQLAEAADVLRDAGLALATARDAEGLPIVARWGQAKAHLGGVLAELGRLENSPARREAAVQAYRAAADALEHVGEESTERMGQVQFDLAGVLWDQSEHDDDTGALLEAVQAYRAAREAFAEAGQAKKMVDIDILLLAAEAEISQRHGKELPIPELPGIRLLLHPADTPADEPSLPASPRPGPGDTGRKTPDLEALVLWATDPTVPPVGMLTGPPGRGKSTLIEQLGPALEAACKAVEVPLIAAVSLSRQRGDHAPDQWLHRLEAALLGLRSGARPMAETLRRPLDIGRACQALVQDIEGGGQRLLIIIDGLEECSDGQDALRWLRPPPSGHVKLLVTASFSAERRTPMDWLGHWGQDGAHYIPAVPLDEQQAGALLLEEGVPESSLTPGLLQSLVSHSEGEPWLLQLYARELWTGGDPPAPPVLLQGNTPGTAGYAEHLIRAYRDRWPLDDYPFLHRCLRLLACGHGPISAGALKAAASHWGECRSGLSDAQLREHLAPFLATRGDALLSFAHPAVAAHLRHHPSQADDMCKAQQALADWGIDEIDLVTAGQFSPEALDPYLTAWLHQHLADANAPLQAWERLFGAGWRQAHRAHHGHLGGFTRDLDAAARAVRRLQPPGWRSQLLRINLMRAKVAGKAVLPPGKVAAMHVDSSDRAYLAALFALAVSWPELGRSDAGLAEDALIDSTPPLITPTLLLLLCRHVGHQHHDQAVAAGLRWWLRHLPGLTDEAAAEALTKLWITELQESDALEISASARASRWTAEQLRAAVEIKPSRRRIRPGLHFDISSGPPLGGDLDALRDWVRSMRGHGAAKVRRHLDAVLGDLKDCPPSLWPDALEGIAHGMADPGQAVALKRLTCDWAVEYPNSLVHWVHAIDGVAGLLALAYAMRESAAIYQEAR